MLAHYHGERKPLRLQTVVSLTLAGADFTRMRFDLFFLFVFMDIVSLLLFNPFLLLLCSRFHAQSLSASQWINGKAPVASFFGFGFLFVFLVFFSFGFIFLLCVFWFFFLGGAFLMTFGYPLVSCRFCTKKTWGK